MVIMISSSSLVSTISFLYLVQYPYISSKQENKNLKMVTEFPLANTHYYCETLDITHKFPSRNSVQVYLFDLLYSLAYPVSLFSLIQTPYFRSLISLFLVSLI